MNYYAMFYVWFYLECIGMTHSVPTKFITNVVGTEWYGMGHAWVTEDGSSEAKCKITHVYFSALR